MWNTGDRITPVKRNYVWTNLVGTDRSPLVETKRNIICKKITSAGCSY